MLREALRGRLLRSLKIRVRGRESLSEQLLVLGACHLERHRRVSFSSQHAPPGDAETLQSLTQHRTYLSGGIRLLLLALTRIAEVEVLVLFRQSYELTLKLPEPKALAARLFRARWRSLGEDDWQRRDAGCLNDRCGVVRWTHKPKRCLLLIQGASETT